MSLRTRVGSGKTNLQLVTGRLVNPETGKELIVNVAIDSCSTGCLMTDYAADHLALKGKSERFILKGITDAENVIMSRKVTAKISSMDGEFSHILKRIRVLPTITNDVKAFDWRPLLSKFGIEGHEPAREGQIDLLIGMNYPRFLKQHDCKEVKDNLLLFKNDLGWSGCGVADRREVRDGHAFKIQYSNAFMTGEDDGEAEEEDLEGEDRTETLKGLCFIANSRKVPASDVKKLIELVQNSTLYDNFAEKGMTVEEERCLKILKDTYRVEDHQAYVSPLWKEGQPSGFTNNFRYCLNRLNGILKGMTEKNFECLDKIFEDYLAKGLVEEVTHQIKDPYEEEGIWWAHFPVINPNSETTPVRPVMDGKAPCINGKSINDQCYHSGPCLINDLVQVLLRYRKYDEAFTGDVSKMFLKIYVPEEMRKYARFIWVQKDRVTPRYFQFKGHVFGSVCSPTCAIYVTQRNAEEHKARMPRAAEAIIKSTLVDDTLDSVPTEHEAVQVIKELVEIFKHIGLDMSKVATTSIRVAKALPSGITKSDNMILFENFSKRDIEYGGRDYAPGTVPKQPTMRTLGQYHNMVCDTMGYVSYTPDQNMEWTKTKVLSQTMKVFDPLGYVVAVMLEPKLIIQELWRREAVWTDTLTPEELKRWTDWLPNLPLMEELQFRRVLIPGLPDDHESVQIHVFADASERAFACASYIRVTYKDGRPVYTNFIQAKCNIAPIKVKRTIPKLELMGIHSAARLADNLCRILDIPKEDATLWSDSKTALQWLRMEPTTLLPLVHNYSQKIKGFFPVDQIRWVPGEHNVADVATRPKTVKELLDLPQWTTGPKFLSSSPESWPVLPELAKTSEVMEGVKKDFRLFTSDSTFKVTTRAMAKSQSQKNFTIPVDKFCSYGKTLRVFAYVIRYLRILKARADEVKRRVLNNLADLEPLQMLRESVKKAVKYVPVKEGDGIGRMVVAKPYTVKTHFPDGTSSVSLRPSEKEEAELRIVRQHQLKFFSREISDIKAGRDLTRSNKLSRLGAELVPYKSCFHGEFDVLRLGGRIAMAPHLCEKMRRPFVLHPDDEMVKRMIQYYHANILKHMGGINCLICEINRSRWIVGSISHLKRILRECYQCRKRRPRPTVQKMAPLPQSRIPGEEEARVAPFTVTSLDVGGPWLTSHGRGKSQTKRWLLIFRCATVGAVHLEMLWGMDTGEFLMALERFICDASTPKRIFCDRGTNITRGDKELQLVWEKICTEEVAENEHGIEFVYSPAEAPHFNGLIERMIGEAKKNLKAILGSDELRLSDQALITSFKQVQRMLNNRPVGLKYPNIDPLDLEPITPAHFLVNGNIFEDLVPPNTRLEGTDTLAGRFWTIQSLMDEFWKRLCRTLAPKLREYNKWFTKRRNVEIGDVVCILEDDPVPNGRYRVGIIQDVSFGIDRLPRRVTIRVKDGKSLDRGLNRIYVLVPRDKLQPGEKATSKTSSRSSRNLKRRKKITNTAFISFRDV